MVIIYPIKIEWKADGVKITNINTRAEKIAGTVTFKTISTLKFVPQKEDDGVTITCFVPATEESTTVKVSVVYSPVVKLTHDKADIMEGDRVVFTP